MEAWNWPYGLRVISNLEIRLPLLGLQACNTTAGGLGHNLEGQEEVGPEWEAWWELGFLNDLWIPLLCW